MDQFLLKLKRGETPFYRLLGRVARSLMRGHIPFPRFLYPLFRLVYYFHFGVVYTMRWILNTLYREPLFRARCAAVGKRFSLTFLPDVGGHLKVYIGDDVNFFGQVGMGSGRILDEPRLVIGNRVDVGHNVSFLANREIIIEDDVKIASGCRFMDTDAHPRDTMDRVRNLPPPPEEIKAVRVCRYAWIGQNAFVLKGVTVGEGAIIGVNSVVVTDIPPYTVALGNPARVVVKITPVSSTSTSTGGTK